MDEKTHLEEQISQMGNVLSTQRVGMDEPLVDADDYPRADIDVYSVRHARSQLRRLQNDHRALMTRIEAGLAELGPGVRERAHENLSGGGGGGVASDCRHQVAVQFADRQRSSRNKNQKGEPLQPCVLRCEYGDGVTIGESPKVAVDANGCADIDFTTTIAIDQEVADWNQMANTPLVLLLMESSVKESRKKKSPSFNKVGVATIDLLPLLFEPATGEQWHRFAPADHVLPDSERCLLQMPEAAVRFETSAPLIPDNVIGELNMLTITLDSLYGIPSRLEESWECHDYITALFLPFEQTDELLSYEKSLCQEFSAEWERPLLVRQDRRPVGRRLHSGTQVRVQAPRCPEPRRGTDYCATSFAKKQEILLHRDRR
ncbi:uncharacterized protein LOC119094339 [Pollicipes pollicipes]|uniref:uncharacterized protein LOC119094339 n=1 Tax=Pollicipes pollicipes TaxID=41117 RepID=UPI001885047B|nr:uncharacterized protein LOC119094339 [Pollicipes pollicipes]